MNTNWLTVQHLAGVARITLNRPERRNALTHDLLDDLTSAVCKAADHRDTRLIVLAANGPVFCAGMDLGEMQQRAAAADAEQLWLADSEIYRDLLVALLAASQPVLGVVQGPALAGGMGLVLGCDLVIASEDVFFALPEPQRGITAAMVTPLLILRAGVSAANYCLFSGQRVSATQAMAWGLCHLVVASDKLAQAAADLTESILTGSPQALAATKQNVQSIAGQQLRSDLDAAVATSAAARATQDAREGLQAFLEKRPPAWQIRTGD